MGLCRRTGQTGAIIRSLSTATGVLVIVALSGMPTASRAQDDEGAAALKAAQCVACHGMEGVSPNPLFPHLAGQRAGYLQRQLEAFQTGERYDPLMTPVAESLTSSEITLLAEHFSRLGPLATVDASRARPR